MYLFKEYKQPGSSLWTDKPRTMLEKVAISQAFRKAFPDIIDGLPYTKEEMSEKIQEITITHPNSKAINTIEEPVAISKVVKQPSTSKVTNTDLEKLF